MAKTDKTNKTSTHVNAPSKLTASQQKIADLKAALQAEIQAQAAAENANRAKYESAAKALPGQFGVETLGEVVSILRKLTKPVGSGKRGKVTPETEAKIVEMAKAGKTGNEIATETGLSVPTIQKVKSKHGLVKVRT